VLVPRHFLDDLGLGLGKKVFVGGGVCAFVRAFSMFALLIICTNSIVGGTTFDPSTFPTISPTTEPSVAPSADPSADPSAAPSAVPSAAPSRVPSASPSQSPTVYLDPKNLGYYYSTIYYGFTCDNLVGNEAAIIEQNGNSFGSCIVGRNSSGNAVSSETYTSSCSLEGDNYVAYYTKYSDTECKNPTAPASKVLRTSLCSTSGDYTTQHSCVASTSNPPYTSLSGGYATW
jgi:hypothetical protein